MHLYTEHSTSLLDEPVTEKNIIGVLAVRNLAFLLDPIIACAFLGLGSKMFPALPSKKEFSDQGYDLDPKCIAKEVRALLFSRRVMVLKSDLASRTGCALGFTQKLRDELWQSLSDHTRSMIQGYISARAAKEALPAISIAMTAEPETCTVPSAATDAGSLNRCSGIVMDPVAQSTVIDELKQQVTSLKRQRLDEQRRTFRVQITNNMLAQAAQRSADANETLTNHISDFKQKMLVLRRKLRQTQYRARQNQDLGLCGRRPVEVRNVCFDPSRQREVWQKRKRDPSLAFECAWVLIRGTKEIKPFGGGLRWTVEARYEEYAHFERSGVDSACRAVWLREAALHGRASRMFVMPIGRKGHLRRNVLLTNQQKKARARNENLAVHCSNLSLAKNNPAKIHDVSAARIDGIAAADDEMTAEELLDSSKPMEGVRLFDHPSPQTTFRSIIPTA